MSLDIEKLVYEAIDQVNELVEPTKRIVRRPSAVLLGSKGALDSLALVNLIVAVEERVEDRYGIVLNLADVTDQLDGPLRDVDALVSHIAASVE